MNIPCRILVALIFVAFVHDVATEPPGFNVKVSSYCQRPAFVRDCRPLGSCAWYYEPTHRNCMMADPTSCGTGPNLFCSKEECMHVCRDLRTKKGKWCRQAPVIGSCDPVLQTWQYDSHKYCKRLNYTICSKISSGFASEEKCLNVCSPNRNVKPVCSLKTRRIMRGGWARIWYFHAGRNNCLQFSGALCARNQNCFTSREKCLERCSYAYRPTGSI
ncbi:papilin-like [Dermacentor silvarum]|uniref:papilin-like n=1 Tax=Dermacentor silvarum TaxID=543639 RepID=UPI00210163BF|nr:papilin-like [Dermacentor silvarum]